LAEDLGVHGHPEAIQEPRAVGFAHGTHVNGVQLVSLVVGRLGLRQQRLREPSDAERHRRTDLAFPSEEVGRAELRVEDCRIARLPERSRGCH
jgi:hypothetical protein